MILQVSFPIRRDNTHFFADQLFFEVTSPNLITYENVFELIDEFRL